MTKPPKALIAVINELTGGVSPSHVFLPNGVLTDELPDMFALYFVKKVDHIRANITSSPDN